MNSPFYCKMLVELESGAGFVEIEVDIPDMALMSIKDRRVVFDSLRSFMEFVEHKPPRAKVLPVLINYTACTEEGCTTVLSRYNKSPWCALHQREHPPVSFCGYTEMTG